jgi:hypothetical protein
MRKFVLIAALAALSACAEESAEPAAEATLVAADEAAKPGPKTELAVDELAGTYDYMLEDGTKGVTVMLANGTFTDKLGGEVVKGSWGVAQDKLCMDPEGDAAEQKESCFALSQPDADGVQVATGDDGSVVKIRKQSA